MSKNQLSGAQAVDGNLARQMLLEQQNKSTLVSFAAFKEASGKAFLFDTVFGPTDWTFAANAYLDFLLEWPEHKEVVTDTDFEVLALEGQKIADFSAAVHRDFTAYSENNESSAVGKLLTSSKTETVAALDTLVDFYENEFFSDELKRTKMNIRGDLSDVDPKQAKISPITDATVRHDFCRFHNSNYIGQAPVGMANLIPLYLRQAMELGIGSVEYCLSFSYNQPSYERNMNPNGATEYETIITGPGPYSVSLKATFVHSSLNCAPHIPTMKGRAQFLHLTLEDKTKMGGRNRVRAPIPEEIIWEEEWKKHFVSTINSGGPSVTTYPAWQVYTDCLEKVIMNRPGFPGELLVQKSGGFSM